MELVVKLFLSVAVFGVTIFVGSLLWPKLTSAPRPEVLQQVHNIVIKTPQGAAAAQVLGVKDDSTVEPINLAQVATDALNGIKSAAEKRAQTILVSQVTQQLMNQYEKLPEDQQLQLQQIICKPTGVVQ
jgi:hypothetical protein